MRSISENEVMQALELWGQQIKAIGDAHATGGDYKSLAEDLADNTYAYDIGNVLFKPTLASQVQFRDTRQGAISYFIGGDADFPEDNGFAVVQRKKIEFENAGMILKDAEALTMGNYYFTDMEGNRTKVEYTFGFFRDEAGKLRINLHHSSLPFQA